MYSAINYDEPPSSYLVPNEELMPLTHQKYSNPNPAAPLVRNQPSYFDFNFAPPTRQSELSNPEYQQLEDHDNWTTYLSDPERTLGWKGILLLGLIDMVVSIILMSCLWSNLLQAGVPAAGLIAILVLVCNLLWTCSACLLMKTGDWKGEKRSTFTPLNAFLVFALISSSFLPVYELLAKVSSLNFLHFSYFLQVSAHLSFLVFYTYCSCFQLTFAKIQILPDSPWFYTGYVMSGKVLVGKREGQQNCDIETVQMRLYGEAVTSWDEDWHRSHKSVEKCVDIVIELRTQLKDELEGSNETTYPFQMFVPVSDNIPSSYDGSFGTVTYYLEVTLGVRTSKWLPLRKCRRRLKVCLISFTDLAKFPGVGEPVELSTSESFRIMNRETELSMIVRLDKGGFYPGEVLRVAVEVNNDSGIIVGSVMAELLEVTDFSAAACLCFGSTRQTASSYGKAVVAHITQMGRRHVYFPVLQIPRFPITLGNCRIMKRNYILEVTLLATDGEGKLSLSYPINIGVFQPT